MHPASSFEVLPELTGVRKIWFSELAQAFAGAGFPGCLHAPPCPGAGPASGETVEALRDRWPPEQEEDYLHAEAVGWFRDER
ncbi:hypothetical protein [Actinoplanes sp. NPDC023714]|uniref:hypothetical protein n=1 Tax=Actinoplanes sp. NPDC023714 TaxID=3154322 RepID=UPI0033E75BF8